MSEIKKTDTELAVTSGFVSTEGMDIGYVSAVNYITVLKSCLHHI